MERRLLAFFREHEQEILEDLKKLVETEAGSMEIGALREVCAVLQTLILERTGVPATVHSAAGGHDVLSFTFGTGSEKILLLGHYDTVHPRGSFPMRQEGDRLLGPGVLDMKSGLIAAIWIIRAFRQLGIEPDKQLVVVMNGDEEIGSAESLPVIRRLAADAKAALVMEPAADGGALKTGRKGQMELTVSISGKASHAGAGHAAGINAIEEMAHEILYLQGLTDYPAGTTVNVGVCSGGSKSNVVPDHAEMEIDCRFTSAAACTELKRKILEQPVVVPGTSRTVRIRGEFPPMEQTAGNLALYARAEEAASVLGIPLEHRFVGGRSDGNLVAAMGIPVLDGLGAEGEFMHSPREYMRLSTYLSRMALTAGLILRI